MTLLILTVFGMSLFAGVMVEGKKEILNGKTTMSTILPLALECDKSYTHVMLGSLTCDSKDVDKKLEKSAVKECEKTVQLSPSGKRVCYIKLSDAKGLNGTEEWRAVYQCNMGKEEKWKKGKKPSKAKQKKAGKFAKLKCKYDEIFVVISVTIDGATADFTKFPELNKNQLDWDCNVLRQKEADKGKKGNVDCMVENKRAYGGELEIYYKCDV